jgi:hypothetical protein
VEAGVETTHQSVLAGAGAPPLAGKLFEQYQLFVEETARISDRRHTTNNLFLSVNSVLLGALALLLPQAVNKSSTSVLVLFLALLLVGAGAVLCVSWRQLLLGYGERLRERFLYLRQLEQEHPDLLLPAFSGRPRQKSFSRMEAGIPLVFLITYFLAVAGTLAFVLGVLAPLQTLLPH